MDSYFDSLATPFPMSKVSSARGFSSSMAVAAATVGAANNLVCINDSSSDDDSLARSPFAHSHPTKSTGDDDDDDGQRTKLKGSDDDDDEVIILEVKTPATKRKERSNMGSRKKSPAKKKMHVNEKPSASVRKGKWYTMYDRAMAAYKKDRFRDLKSGETLYNWLSRMKKERQMLDTFLKEGGSALQRQNLRAC